MATSKFWLSLLLAFLAITTTPVTASPLSRRQTAGSCIVPQVIYSSFDKPFTLSVQKKTSPDVHNRPVSYVPRGIAEDVLVLGSAASKFRLTDGKLYPSQVGIPAYTRNSEFAGLIEIYFPAAEPPEPPTTSWEGHHGCNEDTGAGQLELRAARHFLCARQDRVGEYRLYLKTTTGGVGDCIEVKFVVKLDAA